MHSASLRDSSCCKNNAAFPGPLPIVGALVKMSDCLQWPQIWAVALKTAFIFCGQVILIHHSPECLCALKHLNASKINSSKHSSPRSSCASTTVLSWFQNLPPTGSLLAPPFETGNFYSEEQMAKPWRAEAFLQTLSRALKHIVSAQEMYQKLKQISNRLTLWLLRCPVGIFKSLSILWKVNQNGMKIFLLAYRWLLSSSPSLWN